VADAYPRPGRDTRLISRLAYAPRRMRHASPVARVCIAVSAASAAVLVASCGGEAPPPQAPAPATSAAAPPPPPPPDLSEVPVPPGLVVSGRLAKPSALFATLHGWTKLPMPQSDQVTEIVASEAIGPVVDLDQPIDFALGVTGSGARMKDVRAVSAAVKDPDKVKAALTERYKLVPGDNGVLLIQGLGRPTHDDDADDDGKPDPGADAARVCELAPAFGDAPLRLVCAWSSRALADLGPWLTRSAPRAPTRSDVQIDLRMDPLQETIRERKRLVAMIFGSVVGDRMGLSGGRDLALALGTDLTDFATDLSGASLDLVVGDAGLQAKLLLRLSDTTSAIARLATAHPERGGQAPAAFWQLPGDAELAFFGRGVDEAEIAKGRDLVLRLVDEALTDEGVKAADARPVVDALGKLASPAPMVYASGSVAPVAPEGGGAAGAADPAEAKRAAAEAMMGWRVAELDEPSTRLAAALKSLSKSLESPSIAAAYRSKHKDLLPPDLRAVPVPKSAGLPAGALHYVLDIRSPTGKLAKPPGKKPAPPVRPLRVHLFVVPDGTRTWLALGGEEGAVAAHLALALGQTGDKLATRADLAPLKERAVGSGGFFTARSVTRASRQVAALLGSGRQTSVDEASQMPHKGLAPILFGSTALAGTTPATVEAHVQVPRDAIEDVVWTILQHGGF